ncbi:hypothetical protein [Puerhibacterium sp. TATVAM-FAB25]|uniref:hypothetical protein n=1 Tax=Puerhibacterium sp. TATVAM-FAB25 TaxID=3093699 RepID=UPI0039784BAB
MHRTVLGVVLAAAAGLHQLGGHGGGETHDGDVRQGEAGEPIAPDGRPADGDAGAADDDMPVAAPSEAEATPPTLPEIPPPPVH